MKFEDERIGRLAKIHLDQPASWSVYCEHTDWLVLKCATTDARHESKTKFLQAAIRVIRVKGYTATRVEDVCEAAGLTKGSFFHHFDSKDELALAAADYWIEGTEAQFGSASYHELADPLERLLAYVDFRKALLTGELPDFTCLAGTMVQEVYHTTRRSARHATGASAGTRQHWWPTLKRRCGSAACALNGPPKVSLSTPRLPSRARSSWPRPGAVLQLRRSASIICGDTSSCCSNHRRIPRRPGHREFRQQSQNGGAEGRNEMGLPIR